MNSKELWQRYCKYLHIYPELGFSLDISRIRFADSFFSSMEQPINKALIAMSKLEKGSLANPDENRMVGHYWLRDSTLSPDEKIKSAINSQIQSIKEFAKAIHLGTIKPERSEQFINLLLVGIGGSALGPQLVADALWDTSQKAKLYVCDNTDPDGISRILAQLDSELNSTLVIATSKSGGTPETRNGVMEIAKAYQQKGLNFSKHAVAVTTEESKFDRQAKTENWLKQFYIWDWVGGRTSVFSAVGLLPAALLGIDIDSFLAGAKEMDQITRSNNYQQNPAALLALMWYSTGEGKGKKDMVVLPYKDRLLLMSKYLQQLVMESLGKEKDLEGKIVNQGIAVYGNKGSTDQHAYVQQLREGVNNFFATFIEVLNDDFPGSYPVTQLEVEPGVTSGDYLSGFLQGTRRALFENGRDSITITLDLLNAKSLAALIALFERAVGLYASLVNINAYHQPGVEAGKKAASKVIDLQKALLAKLANNKSPLSAHDLAQAIGAEEEIETVYKILEHLAANPQRKIKRTGSKLPLEAKYSI